LTDNIIGSEDFSLLGRCEENMGYFRFWKRIKIFPGVYLNISKSGISFSFGIKGAKITFGSKGKRATLGIPGTGISYTNKYK
jgi:hypothetical protein